MVVVVPVRCQAEDREIGPLERLHPSRLPQQLVRVEKLAFQEKPGRLAQGADKHAGIGRRDYGVLPVRHGAALPVAYLSLEKPLGRGERADRVQALRQVYAAVVEEPADASDPPRKKKVVIKKSDQGRRSSGR